MDKIFEKIELRLKQDHQVTPNEATVYQIHDALSKLVMDGIADTWYESRHMHERSRGAYYFSAAYLTGDELLAVVHYPADGLVGKSRSSGVVTRPLHHAL